MEQYSYHEETGKITLEKKAVQNSENAGKSIYLMSLDEFLSHPRKLVRKNNFIHSMTPIQYCKIEKYRECVRLSSPITLTHILIQTDSVYKSIT